MLLRNDDGISGRRSDATPVIPSIALVMAPMEPSSNWTRLSSDSWYALPVASPNPVPKALAATVAVSNVVETVPVVVTPHSSTAI